jgi:hypothetical protein
MAPPLSPEKLKELQEKIDITYFMSDLMTQEEFDQIRGNGPIVKYEFNKIKGKYGTTAQPSSET